MLRYLDYGIYPVEIPNELSLGISLLGCDVHCPYCHSQHTWDVNSIGKGRDLTISDLRHMIESQKHISCVLFFGGEWNAQDLIKKLLYINDFRPDLCTALYTGRDLDFIKEKRIIEHLNYLKVGPYNASLGGLRSKTTNQRLYTIKDGEIENDITPTFWREYGRGSDT